MITNPEQESLWPKRERITPPAPRIVRPRLLGVDADILLGEDENRECVRFAQEVVAQHFPRTGERGKQGYGLNAKYDEQLVIAYMGRRGQCAFAKATRLPDELFRSLQDLKRPDGSKWPDFVINGIEVDVRTTDWWPNGALRIEGCKEDPRWGDPISFRYVLMLQIPCMFFPPPDYNLHFRLGGWIDGRDGKILERWKKKTEDRWSYWNEQNELRHDWDWASLTTLPANE